MQLHPGGDTSRVLSQACSSCSQAWYHWGRMCGAGSASQFLKSTLIDTSSSPDLGFDLGMPWPECWTKAEINSKRKLTMISGIESSCSSPPGIERISVLQGIKLKKGLPARNLSDSDNGDFSSVHTILGEGFRLSAEARYYACWILITELEQWSMAKRLDHKWVRVWRAKTEHSHPREVDVFCYLMWHILGHGHIESCPDARGLSKQFFIHCTQIFWDLIDFFRRGGQICEVPNYFLNTEICLYKLYYMVFQPVPAKVSCWLWVGGHDDW